MFREFDYLVVAPYIDGANPCDALMLYFVVMRGVLSCGTDDLPSIFLVIVA